jgi:hypothetical protein
MLATVTGASSASRARDEVGRGGRRSAERAAHGGVVADGRLRGLGRGILQAA